MVSNGERIKRSVFCKKVRVHLGVFVLIEDFLPMRLGGTNLIIGMKWLATVGETCNEWHNLTMKFFGDNKEIILQGDPQLSKSKASYKGYSEVVDPRCNKCAIGITQL